MPIAGYIAREIADRCRGAHPDGDGYRAPCPAHDGGNPDAFHFYDSPDGVVVKCHSHDCSIADMHIAPFGRTLKYQGLYQGPDRCAVASYVPRLITCASS